MFLDVSRSDAANSVTSGCRSSVGRQSIYWHAAMQETRTVPG